MRFLAAPYEILVTDGKMHDADHEEWDRWGSVHFRRYYIHVHLIIFPGVSTSSTEASTGPRMFEFREASSQIPSSRSRSSCFQDMVSVSPTKQLRPELSGRSKKIYPKTM